MEADAEEDGLLHASASDGFAATAASVKEHPSSVQGLVVLAGSDGFNDASASVEAHGPTVQGFPNGAGSDAFGAAAASIVELEPNVEGLDAAQSDGVADATSSFKEHGPSVQGRLDASGGDGFADAAASVKELGHTVHDLDDAQCDGFAATAARAPEPGPSVQGLVDAAGSAGFAGVAARIKELSPRAAVATMAAGEQLAEALENRLAQVEQRLLRLESSERGAMAQELLDSLASEAVSFAESGAGQLESRVARVERRLRLLEAAGRVPAVGPLQEPVPDAVNVPGSEIVITEMTMVNVDSGDDEPCCRICRQGEEAGKLYCPCRCAGSIKWVHESCLCTWLRRDRTPVCELCGYAFEFHPVYVEHAPTRLTLIDWIGAFWSSALATSERVLRLAYAGAVWGVALPLLTVCTARAILAPPGGLPQPPLGVYSFTLTFHLGLGLSLTGIALVYVASMTRTLLAVIWVPADGTGVATPDGSQAAGEATLLPEPPDALAEPQTGPDGTLAVSEEDGDAARAEEELWNIVGLEGNPLRALLCMTIFLCANAFGICVFLAFPLAVGRTAIAPLLRLGAPDSLVGLFSISGWGKFGAPHHNSTVTNVADEISGALRETGLLPTGQSLFLDLSALIAGYGLLAAMLLILIPGCLFVSATVTRNVRASEILQAATEMAGMHAQSLVRQSVVLLQKFAVVTVMRVIVPCYIGHLVFCLLCGPVLRVPQRMRAELANANLPLTLMMQLSVGYSHLWGCAFLEGCVADCVPSAVVRARSNFFLGAMCSHRRLFGTGLAHDGGTPFALPVSRTASLKLAMLHTLFHSALVVVLWFVPAVLLDSCVGNSLFPLWLFERDNTEDVAHAGVGAHRGRPGMHGQPVFALEIIQLYVLVLQCLRVLDASPGLTRLVANGLRLSFRSVGLRHFLAPDASASAAQAASAESGDDAEQQTDDSGLAEPDNSGTTGTETSPAPRLAFWQVLAVSAVLVALAWSAVVTVLVLPLTLGRVLVRQLFATNVTGPGRISDFAALSLGVVAFSAAVLASVKFCEALPAICTRLGSMRGRFVHIVLCVLSFVGMAVAVFAVIPMGLGTMLLRLMLPTKAQSVYHTPVVFLVTDCWSLGLILTKVMWGFAQMEIVSHGMYVEFNSVWTEMQGSFTNLFFDLRLHWRVWRGLIAPLFEEIVVQLIFPRTLAHTLCRVCIPEHYMFLRALVLMFSYQVVLGVRLCAAAIPMVRRWLGGVRQRIFDAKYLVSTELQNYHPSEAVVEATT